VDQHHRQLDPLLGHALQVLAHHHGGLDQQAAHADGVGVVLPDRGQDILQGLLDTQVDGLVTVVGEDDVDQVLADVVDVALDRGQHDGALFPALDLVHVGFQIGDRRLHGLRRQEHEGQLHLAGAEKLAHHLHARQEVDVDDVQRSDALQRLVQVSLQALAVAVDDPVLEPGFHVGGALALGACLRLASFEEGDEGVQGVIAVPAPVVDQILGGLDLGLGDFVQG
jgi:hypothetical protein